MPGAPLKGIWVPSKIWPLIKEVETWLRTLQFVVKGL